MTRASHVNGISRTPAAVSDERIGVNGAIALVITRAVGSMPALYVALAFIGGWMALATWGPLHRVDPYPFAYLLFLNNAVQLVLCLVILVGQRVLGADAKDREDRTYEHAEAIFQQVADLQRHLDRHDRALSRGVSLLKSSPHPWTERHRVRTPSQASGQAVTVNGRIAAWLTRRLSTMWAFYLAAGTQVACIVWVQAGTGRPDSGPIVFMSFLSTLAQLIFMIVIMVGQDVMSQAGDRRAEQTFRNGEAVLYECRRMEVRLTAQDRIIASLTGYVNVQVTERLAQAIHDTYGAVHEGGMAVSLGPWAELPEEFKESNRAQAREIGERLAAIGCVMVPAFDQAPDFAFDDHEVQLLARLEHERWMGERTAQGFEFGPVRGERTRPDLVPWERLPGEARRRNLQDVRRIPAMLACAGFQVLRHGGGAQDGPGEADFDSGEWEILQRAMLAADGLVAPAKGPIATGQVSALVRKLRETSITHPQRFIRELAAASAFNTGLQAGTGDAGRGDPALEVIRSAALIVARKAPALLPDFRGLLAELAASVAGAGGEGGFAGLGAHRRGGGAAVMAAVTRAAALEDE